MAKENINGTASAEWTGYHGQVTVTLTVENGRVADCTASGEEEFKEINLGGRAMREIPERIKAAGSPEVDAIAGATVTSAAIIQAAKAAWNKLAGEETAVRMKPGSYTAGALGFWGIWELPVTVTVNETSILDISVPEKRMEHGETEVMLKSVKERLIPRIIRSQSLAVDAVAGATASSNAVKTAAREAVARALRAGGSDEGAMEHFMKKPGKTELGQVEEREVDLVVVGLSTGGMLAMKRAMEVFMDCSDKTQRIRILGIEKTGRIGGQSSLTHCANALNPRQLLQEVYGGKDTMDGDEYRRMWYEYCTGADGTLKAKGEMIDLFMRESGPTIDWMRFKEGYMFGTVLGHSPFSNFRGQVQWNFFSTTGRDKYQQSFEDRRMAVDAMMNKFASEIRSAGGDCLLETEAYEYIYDRETGTVKGVKARNTVTGKEYVIHAGAVISCSGGFGRSSKLMHQLLDPRWAGDYLMIGNECNDGKFFQAGLDIGAGTFNADMAPITLELGLPAFLKHFPINTKDGQITGRTGRVSTWTYNDIPLYLVFSIDSLAVGPKGQRFGNELGLGRGIGIETAPNSWRVGPYFYSIWSQTQLEKLDREGFRADHISSRGAYRQQGGFPLDQPAPVLEAVEAAVQQGGIAWKGETLADLERELGMPEGALQATVARYNALCAKGEDEDFGKDPAFLTPVDGGPYYAVKAMNVMFGSGGGFDVDTEMRVLQKDGKTPIRGMYAVGTDSFGVVQTNERNYTGFGGVCQGWLLMSARLAGENSAKYVYQNYGLCNEKDPDLEAKPFT